jgi:tripeptide aminopeptidase
MKEVNIKPLINLSVAELMVVNCRTWGYLVPTFFAGHNFHGKYEYVPVESMQKP